jgi:hypothetical protein
LSSLAPITSAIIFVNDDLTPNVEAALQRQLFITDTMTGAEFDARVAADPNYPNIVHLQNAVILVIRSFYDFTNRSLADIVIFVKAGLASVEASKVGPPGLTLPVDRLYLNELFRGTLPSCATFIPNPNAQNNILYPIERHCETKDLRPFGSNFERPETIGEEEDEWNFGIDDFEDD